MKFDRSNKFVLCYYVQVNSLRLKTSVASKEASKHLCGGNVYFAGEVPKSSESVRRIIKCSTNTLWYFPYQ